MRRLLSFTAIAAVLLVCMPLNLLAQFTQSSIVGNVVDATGAPVSGADVTVRNEGTNATRTLKTEAGGEYRISGLEAGFYQVTVANAGFKTFEQTRVDVVSGQTKRVDVQLEVGDISTKVTVEGGLTQIETESASLTNLKTARDFAELPLSVFGRAWSNVTNVTAGVQSSSGFEVNGARDTANNFTADGISVNDMISSRNTANGFSGDIETFQEIRVVTSNSSAEYAQVAQFAAVSKAGTNTPHGALYWGNFNSAFSARSWADRQPVSFTNHNMFAANGGGPVYIPGVYDGRDKTFFFASYSGARYRVGNRLFRIVPTAAMRQGDFGEFTGRITLLDPQNGGQPFPGNRIPQNRLNPVSLRVQELLYPLPNQPGQGTFGVANNFYADPGAKFDSDVYSFRGDQHISAANLLFVRVGLTVKNGDTNRGELLNGYGAAGIVSNIPGRSVVISDTHTFTAALVNELKLGFNRTFSENNDFNYGVDVLSQLGIQGIENPGDDPGIRSMPQFSFAGAIPIAASTGRNRGYTAQNTYQIIDNISWFRGRHTLKAGGDVRRLQVNQDTSPLEARGQYVFDDRLTGLAYANFLLGWPSSAARGIARPAAYPRSTYSGFYIQDDLKLHPRVSLNIGLRYEYQTPWVEKFNRMVTFDPTTGSLVTAGNTIPRDLVPAVAATLPIITAQQANLPERSLMFKDTNNWNPRVGLAIRPFGDTTTVVRAGYGLYTQFWPGLLALDATGGPWQSIQSFFIENPTTPVVQFPAPFQTTSSFSGVQSVRGLSPRFPNEQTHQWNLSLGRQIFGVALDVGYVGTRALNIPYTEDLNLLRPSTVPFSAARRPYPRFNATNFVQTGGSSIYHGLIIQADRRMSGGVWFNINYTLAKALTDVDLRAYATGSQQNQYQRYLERGDDPNIRRQQLRFSYVIDIPYGRGRRFGADLHRAVDFVVGGWQFAGITTMMTGARLSPAYSNADPAGTGQVGGRPDRIGNGNLDSSEMRDLIRTRMPIFDRGAFVVPASNRGFYGNSGRFILTGPGSAIWNASLHKNWALTEASRLQFRWEMFNAFNRANFNNPTTNIQSGDFGLVTTAGAGRSMLFGLRLDF